MSNEKSNLPNAPLDAQNYPANNYPAPPPYSPYVDGSPKPTDPGMYPSIGFDQSTAQTAPMVMQPHQAAITMQPQSQTQPQSQSQPPPVIQQIIQVPHRVLTALGPDSVRMNCPHCQADMNTSVVKDPSIAAYVTAGVLFLVGCVCGCCLVPFCMDSCKVSEHHCANCRRFLGKYSKY